MFIRRTVMGIEMNDGTPPKREIRRYERHWSKKKLRRQDDFRRRKTHSASLPRVV